MRDGSETDLARDALERTRARLEVGDAQRALDELLAAWRAVRAHEIAELCLVLSERANAPIEGNTRVARLLQWASRFRERVPLDLGPLLDDFERSLRHEMPRFVFPRADALAGVADDPRIAAVMLRALAVVSGGPKWEKVVRRYCRALETAGDPRAIAGIEAMLSAPLASHPESGLRRVTVEHARAAKQKLVERFPLGVPELPDSLARVVREVKELAERRSAPIEVDRTAAVSMLDPIYAAPDDDELRLVLADMLVERGDPRGELIVLQVRRANGESTAKTVARERALVKEHVRTFLGPLAAIVSLGSAVFERGFLHKCVAHARGETMADVHFEHVEWATVHEIEFCGPSRITPAMRELRVARRVGDHALRQLVATGHPKLERLELFASLTPEFLTCTRLPALRELTFWYGVPPDSLSLSIAPWAPQLKRLQIAGCSDAAAWAESLARRDHLDELVLFQRSVTARLTHSHGGLALRVAFRRAANASIQAQLVAAWLEVFASPWISALRLETPHDIEFRPQERALIRHRLRKFPNLRQAILPWENE